MHAVFLQHLCLLVTAVPPQLIQAVLCRVFDYLKKLDSDGQPIMINERITDPLSFSKALTAAEKLLETVDPEVCVSRGHKDAAQLHMQTPAERWISCWPYDLVQCSSMPRAVCRLSQRQRQRCSWCKAGTLSARSGKAPEILLANRSSWQRWAL